MAEQGKAGWIVDPKAIEAFAAFGDKSAGLAVVGARTRFHMPCSP